MSMKFDLAPKTKCDARRRHQVRSITETIFWGSIIKDGSGQKAGPYQAVWPGKTGDHKVKPGVQNSPGTVLHEQQETIKWGQEFRTPQEQYCTNIDEERLLISDTSSCGYWAIGFELEPLAVWWPLQRGGQRGRGTKGEAMVQSW